VAEAGEGDFIFVPPYVPHQEINAREGETLECVLVRSDGEAVAVNLPDLEPVVSHSCSFPDSRRVDEDTVVRDDHASCWDGTGEAGRWLCGSSC
jgi:hypothetical protein